MQFNNHLVILYFIPLSTIIYFLTTKLNKNLGKLVLILSSILFYSFGRFNMLFYISTSILFNYLAAMLIFKDKIWKKNVLTLSIIANVLFLFFFKYSNFGIKTFNSVLGTNVTLLRIILPIGISFYTFQQIAYIVSIYNREIEFPNFIDYLTFILYYPKLLMGPLVEPKDFISQLNNDNSRKINLDNIASGLMLLSFGLFKKAFLAESFSSAVSWGYSHLNAATPLDLILVMLFYTFEIYFDFSGYSDMAIGISYLLNIRLPINFDSPYKALSIRDFWKRWHISLTQFFTKYIYIPLGGSKHGDKITYRNTMIVFLISGIWHGANWTFILWGILHGLLCVFERILDTTKNTKNAIKTLARWFGTFLVVNVLWLLFSAESISQWASMLARIISIHDLSISSDLMDVFSQPHLNRIINLIHLSGMQNQVFGFNMWLYIFSAFIIILIPKNSYRIKSNHNIFIALLSAIAFVWSLLLLKNQSTFIYNWF